MDNILKINTTGSDTMWLAAHCLSKTQVCDDTDDEKEQTCRSMIPLPQRLGSGIVIPYEVRTTEKFGRGLYATRNVMKGERVTSGINSLFISSGKMLKAFLQCLPKELHYDFFEWSYFEGNQWVIALDDGSLVNHDGSSPNTGSDPNNCRDLLFLKVGYRLCLESTYALRDIKAGEMIVENYAAYDQEVPMWVKKVMKEYAYTSKHKY